MKKRELNKLLAEGGYLDAAPGHITLSRSLVNAIGDPCDVLHVVFPPIPGAPLCCYSLDARDYDGIIAELADVIEKHYTRAARTLSENVKNGYSGGR